MVDLQAKWWAVVDVFHRFLRFLTGGERDVGSLKRRGNISALKIKGDKKSVNIHLRNIYHWNCNVDDLATFAEDVGQSVFIDFHRDSGHEDPESVRCRGL